MRSIENLLRACARTGVIAALIGLLGLVFVASGAAATVTVAAGETLSHVAARNGVSVAELAAANGISDPDLVVAGTRLQVSGSGGAGAPGTPSAGAGSHRVAAGDTLSGIAARYGTSAEVIASRNGISVDGVLSIGTVLSVGGSSAGSAPVAASASVSGGSHRVASGDTLSGIAARYGTSAEVIASRNGISLDGILSIGTVLSVAGSGGVSAPAAGSSTPAAGSHRVAAGETLSGIAARHGVSATAIARANGMGDADMVIAGSSLTIPGGTSAAAPAPSAAPVPSGGSVASLLDQASARHGVPADLSRAVAWQESGWSQSARSSVGAIGVMQLMPATASWFGPNVLGRSIDPYSVSDNVDAGVAYLAYLQRELRDPDLAVGAYYRGPNAVRKFGLGTETQAYVSSVRALRGTV